MLWTQIEQKNIMINFFQFQFHYQDIVKHVTITVQGRMVKAQSAWASTIVISVR